MTPGGAGLAVADLPWPDAPAWAKRLRASPVVSSGAGRARSSRATRSGRSSATARGVYLERYWRHERMVGSDLLRRAASDTDAVLGAVPHDLLDQLFGPGGRRVRPISSASRPKRPSRGAWS